MAYGASLLPIPLKYCLPYIAPGGHIACMLIITVLLLYGVYHWRTASLRKEKLILEQTVHQRTIEVVKQKDEAEKQRAEAEKQTKNKY